MKKPLLITLIFFLFQLHVIAQTSGKIAGKVIDTKTSELLIGASVGIQGATKATAANVDGQYMLSGLLPGKYTVVVKYMGYQTKLIADVDVKAGTVTDLDIPLSDAATTIKEVVVTSSFRQASTASLYAAQKNSASISDGISSDLIKRSPDRSTSDVLKRVSGATIQDNKFVIVRGLSDRYNTAALDGTSLPSTEPNRKAFSFDIVPANLIDNLVINKTATPNLPGDFAGGAVQIFTKDMPDENFFSVSAGVGYNTNTTFKDFKSGYRNLSDYFGFDNGSRKLPGNFPSTSKIISSALTSQQSTAALSSLNPNFNVYNYKAAPNQNYQLSFGHVKDVGTNGNRFGAIFALTYRNTLQTIPDVNINYYEFKFNDAKYKFSTNIGALANFAYIYGKNKITFKNIYNRAFDDQYLFRTGYNNQTGNPDNHFTAFDLIEKSLYKATLQGEHALGSNNSKITWTGSYSNVTNNQPDQRKTNYALINGAYIADNTSVGKQNARFFSDLNENIFTGQVDYSLPVNILKQKAVFKTGISSQYRDRSFTPRFIGPQLKTNVADADAIRQLPLNQIFSRSIIDAGYYDLNEITTTKDLYTANTLTNAAYAMLDNKFGEKLRLVWGLRVEKFDLHLNDNDPTTTETKLDNLDFLPSANFTYSVTPKSNFRLSYSRTIARPELRELSVFGYYDFELLATIAGNSNLKSAQIQNADIRYEFYPSAGQIISISGFYKNFKNAIEPGYNDKNSTPDFQYFNVQQANNYGVELELRKTLDFISSSFKNTTLYTNLALIKSKVTDTRPEVIADESGSRPMVGQAPYVINAGFLQTAYNNKLSFNLLYNRVGSRLFRARGAVFPAIYENARDVLDFQISYRVMKSKGEFKLNASDMLNQSTLFYYKESTKQYDISRGSTISRYNTGSSFTLSYAYSF
ncbi:TonB-dependent receptor [Mucilaginibacter sp.]|uniref:TonB-dependent receptor n=1 Tax=Mucilaginibacter sp. TaxID=1882438 RepID=UPI0026187CA2|nr:TonB-dependent receptor [Mucilaginibacter sp.]MDB4927287.1 TonB-dependent receptor [Mucilaginibacter sp.]